MLREPEYYTRLIDSFGIRSALGVALVDAGRPETIGPEYADLDVPAEFSGQHVMRWLEAIPEQKCRDLLALTLKPVAS